MRNSSREAVRGGQLQMWLEKSGGYKLSSRKILFIKLIRNYLFIFYSQVYNCLLKLL